MSGKALFGTSYIEKSHCLGLSDETKRSNSPNVLLTLRKQHNDTPVSTPHLGFHFSLVSVPSFTTSLYLSEKDFYFSLSSFFNNFQIFHMSGTW